MGTILGLVKFLGMTMAIELALFVILALLLGPEESVKLTILMILPALWAARLFLGLRRGRITRRLLFLSTLGIPTSLSLFNPDLLRRDGGQGERWRFQSYIFREFLLCLLLWALMVANMILPRIGEVFR